MTNERINKVLAELKEYGQMKKELDSQIKALQDECKLYMTEHELSELFNDDNSIVEELTERADTIDEAINSLCLPKNKCSADKILTKISPKQKAILDKEDKEIQKMIYEAGRALEEFKNGYR